MLFCGSVKYNFYIRRRNVLPGFQKLDAMNEERDDKEKYAEFCKQGSILTIKRDFI
jgi:hypothetical protein